MVAAISPGPVAVVVAAVAGLIAGSVGVHLAVREPAYAEDSDELEVLETVPPTSPLVVLRPDRWRTVGWWHPVVEVLCAAVCVLTVFRFADIGVRLAVGFLLVVLVTLSVVDFRVYRIPDRINLPAMAAAAALIGAATFLHRDLDSLTGAAAGGVIYFGLLFVAHFAFPAGMGFGDVKLAFLMGLYLGWLGWEPGSFVEQVLGATQFVLYAATLGSFLGVVTGVPYALVKRSMRVAFPYGPSLAAGCAVVVLLAERLR